MSARVWILLVFLSVLWGGTFLFNHVAVAELPPVTLVFLRCAIAAVVLLPVLRAAKVRLPATGPEIRDVAVMGLLNNVIPFILIVWSQKSIPGGLASILNATTPVFAVVLAHLLAGERATPLKLAGVATGVAGVAVLVGLDQLQGLGHHFAAELACVGAAVSYGLSSVWSRRFRNRPPLATAAGQLTASSLILLPIALAWDAPWRLGMPSWPAILSVLGLAVLSSALAYVVFFRIVSLAGATNAMLVTLLIPPSAILLGWSLLGERLAPQHLAGMAVIFAGLLLIDGRLFRRVGLAKA